MEPTPQSQQSGGSQNPVVIDITKVGSEISVSDSAVRIKKNATMSWDSNEDNFMIVFRNGGPFVGQSCDGLVEMNKAQASQLVARDVRNDFNYDARKNNDGAVTFKYDVVIGDHELDPEVIVDPDD